MQSTKDQNRRTVHLEGKVLPEINYCAIEDSLPGITGEGNERNTY